MTNYPRTYDLRAQLAEMEKRLYAQERRLAQQGARGFGMYHIAAGTTQTGWRCDNRGGRTLIPGYDTAYEDWLLLTADGGIQAVQDGVWVVHSQVRFSAIAAGSLKTIGYSTSPTTTPDNTYPNTRVDAYAVGTSDLTIAGTFTFPVKAGQVFYRWCYNTTSSNTIASTASTPYQSYHLISKV